SPSWWGVGGTQEVAFATDRGGTGSQIWTVVPNGTLPAVVYTAVTAAGSNGLHPSVSPGGQEIGFSSGPGGGAQVFVVTRNGGGGWSAPAQITTGGAAKANPAWSPNGRYIAYSVTTGGHAGGTQAWICNADGSTPQLVTSAGSYDAEPSWAPDCNQLAF